MWLMTEIEKFIETGEEQQNRNRWEKGARENSAIEFILNKGF